MFPAIIFSPDAGWVCEEGIPSQQLIKRSYNEKLFAPEKNFIAPSRK